MRQDNDGRRSSAREFTTMPVECRIGGITATGVIRDISEGGAFVAFGAQAPPPDPMSDNTFARTVEIGDTLLLSYRPRPHARPAQAMATLRWAGYSQAHRRYGCGFEFDIV